jgi:hypothetical protein
VQGTQAWGEGETGGKASVVGVGDGRGENVERGGTEEEGTRSVEGQKRRKVLLYVQFYAREVLDTAEPRISYCSTLVGTLTFLHQDPPCCDSSKNNRLPLFPNLRQEIPLVTSLLLPFSVTSKTVTAI